jgi:putative intracellular protease/amidase
MSKKIVIVLTSHDRLGSTGEKTGFWLEELATPYYVFTDAGYDVELASPRGGLAPYDPKSLDREGNRPASVVRFLADPTAMAKIERTTPFAALDAERIDALFIAGGHGTMWDLPTDARLQAILARLDERRAAIGAVCHGPAGLVGARTQTGKSILDGKNVTSFTDQEEAAIQLTNVVPFLLEQRLRSLIGTGRFTSQPMWQPHAVRDGHLVTGQNPQSSERTAKLVLEALALAS